ncbi:hypothetical protein ACFFU1_16660 [Algibacter miyuki]|uniref:Lipoprotein n=1 Tax=Algibacter miyuki TaxID=1306933 RepID=A0ABV5H3R6_9FLAO|nr:hypothetical protein [Algibacter miyuki]MDN3665611.1 hypothetical protein [Algibacter miyuki]
MKNFIQITAIIVFAVLFLNQCKQTADLKKSIISEAEVKADTIEYYKNKLGLEVAQKQAYKLASEKTSVAFNEAKTESAQFEAAAENWKDLYSALKIEVEFKADSVDIPFDEKVDFNFSRAFYKKNDLYTFSGVVNQHGIIVNTLAKATITPFTGEKNTGFLTHEFRTEITSSNASITIPSFDSYNFTGKQKRFGVGVSFGLGFYHKGFFVGPSINYNLIQF